MTTERTFEEFMRDMDLAVRPRAGNREHFAHCCDLMWHDGILSCTTLARTLPISKETTNKWVHAARELGAKQGLTRKRNRVSLDSLEAPPEQPKFERKKPEVKNHPLMGTPEEARSYLLAQVAERLDNAQTTDEWGKAAQRAMDLKPGLKAPETRLDVQLIIGRDSADQIEAGLVDNFRWLLKNDTAYAKNLLAKIGAIPDLAVGEVNDAAVDDEHNADGQEPGKLPGQ